MKQTIKICRTLLRGRRPIAIGDDLKRRKKTAINICPDSRSFFRTLARSREQCWFAYCSDDTPRLALSPPPTLRETTAGSLRPRGAVHARGRPPARDGSTARRLGFVAARTPDGERDALDRVSRRTVETRARAPRGGCPGIRPRARGPRRAHRRVRAPTERFRVSSRVLRPCRLVASPDRCRRRRARGILAGGKPRVPSVLGPRRRRRVLRRARLGRGRARPDEHRRVALARTRHEDARLLRPGRRARGRRRGVHQEGRPEVGDRRVASAAAAPGRLGRVRRARPRRAEARRERV